MKAWIPLTLVFCSASLPTRRLLHLSARTRCPPDGATATKDQMIAAKTDFTRYNTEMNAYLECIKLEMDAATRRIRRNCRRREEEADDSKRYWCRKTTRPLTNYRPTSGDSTNN